MEKNRVCYILSYKDPNYVRSVSLIESLKMISSIDLIIVKNSSTNILRYIQTFIGFIKSKIVNKPDIYIIGFRGHEIYWFLRIFARREQFIFDEMMSPFDSLANERKKFGKNSIILKLLGYIEKSILIDADKIITDTNLHKQYISKQFQIKKEKIIPVPVGTIQNESENSYSLSYDNSLFSVFTYATFLPLHGMDVISEAVNLLGGLPIKFIIMGGKNNEALARKFCDDIKLKDSGYFEYNKWIEYSKLNSYISRASICLGGPFGGTGQAKRVITGKTQHFLYMKKPVIVGEIDEPIGFKDKYNCLLIKQNSPKDLANAIKWCFQNQQNLRSIGSRGRKLFDTSMSYSAISHVLEDIIN